MTTELQVWSHSACRWHDPGPGHPESPVRLLTLLQRLESEGIAVSEAEPATPEELATVHAPGYRELLAATADRDWTALDGDTVAIRASWNAIRGAAGAALAAARVAGAGGRAFAAVRPPGHHALADRAMGFCFLAHAALGARDLLARDAERVLIVDWDVHHGNGTQALVETDPRIRFVSLHQWPAYPGTGRVDERGCGNIWNLPLAPGLDRARYRETLWQGIEQAGEGWIPDALVISAGFDSLAGDPLGGFTLEPSDLEEITLRLRTRWPRAGIASLLEGGYRPDRLADGVLAHLRALGT